MQRDNAASIFSADARWIGPADWRDDAVVVHPHPFLLWRTFESSGDELELLIAGSPQYAVFLDGSLCHDGPARSLPGEAFVDSLRIAIDPGRSAHVVAVVVHSPTGVSAYQVQDRVGVIAEIRCGDRVVVTDASWSALPFTAIEYQGRLCSLATCWQEHWSDRATTILGSREPTADAKPARVLGSVGTPPWRRTLRRDCAILERSMLAPVIRFAGRDDGTTSAAHVDLARAFNRRELSAVHRPVDARELRLDASMNVITLDAGRTRLVRPRVTVHAASPGQRLELFYDIGIVERPRASLGFESDREGFADSLALSGEPCKWQPSLPRGARYVTLRLAGPGHADISFELEASDYPYRDASRPTFDDVELDEIYERSLAALRSSTTDAIVDTCWRENMLWTADAALTGETHWIAFRDATMWRRSLGLIARWMRQAGPWCGAVVPSGSSAVCLPDQAMQAIIALESYAARTGDLAFASESASCFAGFLAACAEHVTADDLFIPPDWCWHWIDWAPIDRRAYSMPINLLLLLASESATRLASDDDVLHRSSERIATRLRPRLEQFWDDARGCFRDRIEPRSAFAEPNQVVPMPSAEFSAHANALAIRAGIGGPERSARAASWLASELHALPFGPGYTGVVLGTLVEHGHASAAIVHLKRLYRPWLESNQPTWSEAFGQSQFNTAHGWGATALIVLDRFASSKDRSAS